MLRPSLRSIPARRLAGEASVTGLLALPLAYGFLGLWRADADVPFTYRGDGIYYAMISRLVEHETWYFRSSNMGWPFGLQLHDVPEAGDSFHLVLLKLLGLGGSPGFAMNAFYVLSFVLVAAFAHVALRALGVRPLVAGAVALLYSFSPYHFSRNVDHLFLSAYEMVPIAVVLALALLDGDTPFLRRDGGGRWPHIDWRAGRTWWVVAACAGLAVSGPYYFVFFLMLIGVAAIVAALGTGRWRPLLSAAMMGVVTVAVFAVAFLPALAYHFENGRNPAVVNRQPVETEYFGLRIAQLFLPKQNHRIIPLNDIAVKSQQSAIWAEDGQQVGLLGSAALAGILVVFAVSAVTRGAGRRRWLERPKVIRLSQLGMLAVVCMVVGAVGGLSYIISWAGLREIRGWNRISIVITFLAFAAVAIVLDAVVTRVQRWLSTRAPKPWVPAAGGAAVVLVVLAVGLFEQTPRVLPNYAGQRAEYTSDEAFFAAVAAEVPGGTVFQLPRMPFPESPARFGTNSYDQAKGYIFQPDVRWSWGYVTGRQPDYALTIQDGPPERVARYAVAMGFDALVLDRIGFVDNGLALETAITADVGPPRVVSNNARYLFFDLRDYGARLRSDPATAAALDAERASFIATGQPTPA